MAQKECAETDRCPLRLNPSRKEHIRVRREFYCKESQAEVWEASRVRCSRRSTPPALHTERKPWPFIVVCLSRACIDKVLQKANFMCIVRLCSRPWRLVGPRPRTKRREALACPHRGPEVPIYRGALPHQYRPLQLQ